MSDPDVHKQTILVVDDEPELRNGIRYQLRRINATIPTRFLEAGDVEEAHVILSDQTVDCVLLDYQLPGMDGLSFLQELVHDKPDTPVIMMTGHGDENLAVQAMKAGASDYLIKGNIHPAVLMRSIFSALEKKVLKQRLEAQNKELIDAERVRVMVESLGAACHHIGQPVTVILLCLDMLKNSSLSENDQEMLDSAYDAVEQIKDILQRMQTTSEYRTIPYKTINERAMRILDLRKNE